MKAFFTTDETSLQDGIGILGQEGFKFEHFVHALWPTSIARWRWEKSCKGSSRKGEKDEDDPGRSHGCCRPCYRPIAHHSVAEET